MHILIFSDVSQTVFYICINLLRVNKAGVYQMKVYYAKSKLSDGRQPLVKEHLEKVADLARSYGSEIGLENEAYLAGMLHDFGKYSESFQQVLHGKHGIDHAFCGAALLASRRKKSYSPIIEAINGHHSGIAEFSANGILSEKYKLSVSSDKPIEANDRKQSALAGEMQYTDALNEFRKDFPDFVCPKLANFLPSNGEDDYICNIESMLYTRMITSCLVDADYSVSASDEDMEYLENSEICEFNPKAVLGSLTEYRSKIKAESKAASELNALRDYVYERCGEAGKGMRGLFTLTAPTGTGKTLALLNFALSQCIANGQKRIIIVLPFLSLTEQNADVYRRIFPQLFEDHSQSRLDDDQREFSSRWRVPMIVTTSVRFFESLFARKPTDCRKIHNIANSVIIFDEAQSLPVELTQATLRSVNELCGRYGCTMLFSTATQPDFSAIRNFGKAWSPREVLDNGQLLYSKLKRTEIAWRIGTRTALADIASEMAECSNCCTIVNIRKHAYKLYDALKELCNDGSVFCITTDLCAEHRRSVIAEIKRRQEGGLPCRVVATQCIEAGVDLDFDKMYRALAPLEAIIQAAGRCNRNGNSALGEVVVFIPDEETLYPGDWYGNAAETVRQMQVEGTLCVDSLESISEYYRRLFRMAKDKPVLVEAVRNRSFEQVEKEYKLIENTGIRVIVPYKKCLDLFSELYAEVTANGISPSAMKRSAGITVSCNVTKGMESTIEKYAERLPYSRNAHGQKADDCRMSDYYIVRPDSHEVYDDDSGLQWKNAGDYDIFHFML